MKRALMKAVLPGLLLVALTGVQAQDPGASTGEGDVAPGELREAMRDYFEKRLRSDLALSDSQMEHILPRVLEFEQTGREARNERMEAARKLRRGLEQGATDKELQQQLDRLEGLDDQRRSREKKLLREIDQVLSTRQRVQLRFFVQRFRGEMFDRVRQIREDRMRRRPGPNRRPRRGR